MVRSIYNVYTQPEVEESGQMMFLSYEDFVRDPVHHGEPILDHFNESATSSFRKQLERARTSSIGSYKQRDPHEIAAEEPVAGSELVLYGYL